MGQRWTLVRDKPASSWRKGGQSVFDVKVECRADRDRTGGSGGRRTRTEAAPCSQAFGIRLRSAAKMNFCLWGQPKSNGEESEPGTRVLWGVHRGCPATHPAQRGNQPATVPASLSENEEVGKDGLWGGGTHWIQISARSNGGSVRKRGTPKVWVAGRGDRNRLVDQMH